MEQNTLPESNSNGQPMESSEQPGGEAPAGAANNESGSASSRSGPLDSNKLEKGKSGKGARVSFASPRFWHGMRFLTFMRLLWNGGFRIHFLGIGMMVAVFLYSIGNSVLSFVQWIFLGRRINNVKIDKPPVFIVGHWRSGTTLVHELMNLDENLAAPNTYQCFAPCHFPITEWCMKPMVGMAMPKTRPMDNMATGPNRPNEDEFAICALGGPSPYTRMAFPNLPKPHQNLIDMKNVSEEDLRNLEHCIEYFAKALTYKNSGRRLVLKSPTHTGRIEFLRKVFPGAKFLHISRDPKDVIPSTVRLWKRLDTINGFQIPSYEESELENYVGQTFQKMYVAYEEANSEKHDDLATIKYEDLVANPVESLRGAYGELGLDGFESLEPRLREYMESQSDYKRNQHQLNDCLREIINQHCGAYQEKYGYEKA